MDVSAKITTQFVKDLSFENPIIHTLFEIFPQDIFNNIFTSLAVKAKMKLKS